MKSKLEPLHLGAFYHVYNRANGSDKLFRRSDNYFYFLKKYCEYAHPLVKTYAYCLMPNHFHFLIQVREESEILKVMEEKKSKLLNPNPNPFEDSKPSKGLGLEPHLFSKFISQQFSHFFNGYTQAFNKQQNRKGSLFMTPYKRKLIDSEKYWRELIR